MKNFKIPSKMRFLKSFLGDFLKIKIKNRAYSCLWDIFQFSFPLKMYIVASGLVIVFCDTESLNKFQGHDKARFSILVFLRERPAAFDLDVKYHRLHCRCDNLLVSPSALCSLRYFSEAVKCA